MRLTEINTQNITDDIIKKVLFSTIKSEFLEADCLIIFGCHLKPLLDERLECAIKIFYTNIRDTNLINNKKIVLVSNQAHLRRIGMELKKQLAGDKFDLIYE